MNAPKVLQISTDEWPEHERLAALREIYGRTIIKHDIEPLDDKAFYFKADLFGVPTMGLATSSASPCRAVRGLRDADSDDLVFTITLEGTRIINQDGRREVTLHAGDALLMSGAETGTTVLPNGARWRSVRMPRTALGPMIAPDACLGRPIGSDHPPLRLLSDYLAAIQLNDVLARPELVDRIVAHVHDLVSLTLAATRDGVKLTRMPGVRTARLQAIRKSVMDSLSNSALSASAVAARHGITPRYMHMLFEDEGTTFMAFLIEQRLALAYRMLSEPQYSALKISTISERSGFEDISWFNRTFRRHYGATPSEIREAARRKLR